MCRRSTKENEKGIKPSLQKRNKIQNEIVRKEMRVTIATRSTENNDKLGIVILSLSVITLSVNRLNTPQKTQNGLMDNK